MMQMLQAGGMPLCVDAHRPADVDNPYGYWEYEPVKNLQYDNSWLHLAEGKALKVISALLPYLPVRYTYRVIFMQRPLAEVLASQRAMLQRQAHTVPPADETMLYTVFAQHVEQVQRWLAAQAHMTVLPVSYHSILADPRAVVTALAHFLEQPLATEAMVRVVDTRLYRQRAAENPPAPS